MYGDQRRRRCRQRPKGDRCFIRKMDFTHINSWLELSMEGYLVAICIYVEGELGTEILAARQPNECAHIPRHNQQ